MRPIPAVEDAIALRERYPGRYSTGVVYFALAHSCRAVKIGFTKEDSDARVRYLQCGSPEKLEWIGDMPGSRILEKALHSQFASTRLHGEWFRISEPLREFIMEWITPFDPWPHLAKVP